MEVTERETDRRRFPRRGVKGVLLSGVLKRIVIVESVLLVILVAWRCLIEGGTLWDHVLFALRIITLVGIAVGIVWLSLHRFLTARIIRPLETIAEANRRLDRAETPDPEDLTLPPETPREILNIAASRRRMLHTLLEVSDNRLKQAQTVRETFGRYVTREVAEEILSNPESRSLGGRRETVTILMSDLRGYTRYAQEQDPEEAVRLLNLFLGRMAGVIQRFQGLIDEFIGDAIMVIFGAPAKRKDDPLRAAACALAMQQELAALNREILEAGGPPLEMGIGINTGPVILGNIGSASRVKYGVVGAAVNTTSRIESNSLGGQVLLGEATYDLIKDAVQVEKPRTAMMKGISRPLVFYPLLAVDEPYHLELPRPGTGPGETRLNLPLSCWLLEDKRIAARSCSGETLTFSGDGLTARLGEPVEPLRDVLLRLEFCLQAHCFRDIYAKVIRVEETPAGPVHQLSITSMAQEDRELLEKWRVEAG